ncbi:MAG: beta-ketoacyl-[acyl-carrier-protein] synthase family protein, partial [Desulfovibrionaceae bacterium]|nr:beta-ketoacyl-[acyl-carrier-protein] synthase family protein [Desulfovibrionaceae bacterium]
IDVGPLPVRIAARIRGFDVAGLPRAVQRASSPFMQYAFAAAGEALSMSALDVAARPERVGVVMGTAMGGVSLIAQTQATYDAGRHKVSPCFVPAGMGNMAAAHVAITYGMRGPGLTVNTACSAGGDALMLAAMLLLADEADAMLVMGGESILSPVVISSLAQAKALSRRNDAPQAASRPFDLERDGFVIGEGGGAILLESEAHALARGARIYAVLAGWGNSMDGYHITAPAPDGSGAVACMRAALGRAHMLPTDIGYINAHGTSTPLGDRAETLAIKKVFGGRDTAPPVSSTKGATGHLMGAGGLTEVITCVMALEEGLLPPTLNLTTPDPECDLDYVPNTARPARITAAMSNSLGFGGQNSSIIVSRYAAT